MNTLSRYKKLNLLNYVVNMLDNCLSIDRKKVYVRGCRGGASYTHMEYRNPTFTVVHLVPIKINMMLIKDQKVDEIIKKISN